MWLIRTDTFQLEQFFGDDAPAYAILSHTWGSPNEELSFRDMKETPVPQKPGCGKIIYLCKQAMRDGYSWAWCDTCCIDQSSSAELSEAINSMYKWYGNAAICYAYLSDVLPTSSEEAMIESFGKSRWFTRGWTLQELLAPRQIKFYNRDWEFLGSKKDLQDAIKKVTGIGAAVLAWPWTLKNYCVANKMCWASQRVTTRVEDRAYCMLGILGVNIPLLYGEGHNAFRRLQEELIRTSDDESVFAHSGPNMVADGPEAFHSGTDVAATPMTSISDHSYLPSTALTADLYHPFTSTNVGVSIRVRLVSEKPVGKVPQMKKYGVLKCRDAVEYKHFLGVPLQATAVPDVYVRAPGDLHRVTEAEALAAESRPIFIKQREAPATQITCFLHTTLEQTYDIFVHSNVAYTTTPGYRRINIYIDPNIPHSVQKLQYKFRARSKKLSFVVTVFFELTERCGVSITLGENASMNNPKFTLESLQWRDSAVLNIPKGYDETADLNTYKKSENRISVKVEREARLNQNVWLLTLSNNSRAQNAPQ